MPVDAATARRAIEEELYRRAVRRSFLKWCNHVLGPLGLTPARHHLMLIQALQDVADGVTDRLMVWVPPGSGKSTITSILYPAWLMAHHPGCRIIGASHTIDLAERFSQQARRMIEEHSLTLGYNLHPDSRSKELWETNQRPASVYKASSVGGSVTGSRCTFFICDDPTRGREAAESPIDQQRVWNWFANDAMTRLIPYEPGNGIRIPPAMIIVATRWSENDLSGQALANDGPDRWRIIRLPALAEPGDPLGRQEGEPLWPEWEPLEVLEEHRRRLGERDFQSLYQQNPRPPGGGLFHTQHIKVVEAIPAGHTHVVRAWDLSATAGGDWTVGCKLAKYADDTFCILDVVRTRGDPSHVEATIRQTAAVDGASCPIDLPQDPGAAGISTVRYLTTALQGYSVTASRESGSKEDRARPVISQTNVGNLRIVRNSHTAAFLDELAGFPGNRFDDCVDALSRAFNFLVQPAKPARWQNLNLMGR